MSTQIDQRVVEMTFDNAQFEKGIKTTLESLKSFETTLQKIPGATAGLSMIQGVANKVSFRGLSNGVQEVTAKFNVMDMVAARVLSNIAMRAIDTGARLVKSVTIDQIMGGWGEYELKMGSIQTIMASTGESLATVNKYLQELNAYSDQTIYSFSDMTNNIGKFTNAGVKLEDAVAAIKGVSNVAAISGANAGEASRAMYNFSQALSAGFVKLIDWKSIENANMATVGFKNALLTTANAMGKVKKDSNGMYKVLTTNTQGSKFEQSISATKNFNDSLNYQWMTTEVLTETLNQYSTDVTRMTKAEVEAYEARLKGLGYTEEQIKAVEKLGTDATKAATEVKTFSMMIDALGEAVGSGWATTFEIIFGDFEQGKQLWTNINNVLSGVLGKIADTRNNLLRGFLGKNVYSKDFQQLKKGIKDIDGFEKKLIELGKKEGHDVDALIKRYGSFDESLKAGWVSLDMYKEALKQTGEEANGVAANMTKLGNTVKDVILGKYKNGTERVKELTKANKDYALVQALVNAKLYGYDITTGKFTEEQIKHIAYTKEQAEALRNLQKSIANSDIPYKEMLKTVEAISKGKSGREHLIDTFANVYKYLSSIVGTIQSAMEKVFDPFDAEAAFNWLRTIDAISSSTLILNERQQELIHTNAYQFFDALKDIGGIVSEVIRGAATIAIPTLEAILSISRAIYWLFAVRIRHLVVDVIHAFIDGFKMGAEGLIEAIEGFKDFGKWLDILIDDIQIFDDNISLVTAIGKAFGKILVAALKAVVPALKFVLTGLKLLIFGMQRISDNGFVDVIVNIVTTFLEWVRGLQLTSAMMTGLKRISKGFFAVIDLIRRGVLALVKIATPFVKVIFVGLSKIAGAALHVLGVIGQLIYEFKQFVAGGELTKGFVDKLFGENATQRISSIRDALKKIKLPDLDINAGGFVDSAIDAFKTLGDTVGSTFTSSEGFSFSNLFDNVYNGIGRFISDIQKAAEENTNLGEVLGGVKDKLDVLDESFSDSSTFVGTLWKGLKGLIGLLKTTFEAIRDFASKVHATFKKYLDFGGFFTDLWNNFKVLRDELKKIKDTGKGFKDTVLDVSKAFGTFFTSFGTSASTRFNFSGLVTEIQNGVSLMWEAFKTLITGKEEATIGDVLSTIFDKITSSIGTFFSGLFTSINEVPAGAEKTGFLGSFIQKLFGPINEFLNSTDADGQSVYKNASGFISAFVRGIRDGLKDVDTTTIKHAVVFGVVIYTILNVMKTMKTLANWTSSVDGLISGFNKFLGNFNSLMFEGSSYIKAKRFQVYAQSILILAGSMYMLGTIDKDKLLAVTDNLLKVVLATGILFAVITAISNWKMSKRMEGKQGNAIVEAIKSFVDGIAETFESIKRTITMIGTIGAITAAIAALAFVITKIVLFAEGTTDTKNKVWNAIALLGVIGGFLVVFTGVMSYISTQIPANVPALFGNLSSMIGLAAALYLVILAVKGMTTIDTALLKKNLLPIIGIILALGAAGFALGRSKGNILTGLGSIFSTWALAVGLHKIIQVVKDTTQFNLTKLKKNLLPIVGIILTLGAAAWAMGNVAHGYAAGTTFIAIGAALWLMCKGFAALGDVLKTEAIVKRAKGVFVVFGLILGVITLLVGVLGYFTKGISGLDVTFIAIGTFLAGLGAAFLGLGAGIYLAADSLPAFADGMIILANKISENSVAIIKAVGTVVTGIAMAWQIGKIKGILAAVGMVVTMLGAADTAMNGMSDDMQDSMYKWIVKVLDGVVNDAWGALWDFGKSLILPIGYAVTQGLADLGREIIAKGVLNSAELAMNTEKQRWEMSKGSPQEDANLARYQQRVEEYKEALKNYDAVQADIAQHEKDWLLEHAKNNVFIAARYDDESNGASWTAYKQQRVLEAEQKYNRALADVYNERGITVQALREGIVTEEQLADAKAEAQLRAGQKSASAINEAANLVNQAQQSMADSNTQAIENVQNSTETALEQGATVDWSQLGISYDDFMSYLQQQGLTTDQISAVMGTLGNEGVDGGMATGIIDGKGLITNALASVGLQIPSEMSSLLDINSPSRVMRDEVGIAIPEGVAVGIDEGAVTFVRPALQRLGNTIATAFSGNDISGAVANAATSAVTAAGNAFANADTAQFSGAGDKAYEAYGGGIVKKSGQMKTELSKAMLAAVKGASAYIARFRTLGEQGGIGFINGMRSKLSAAAKAGADIARAALNAVQTTQDSASPSKKFAKLGADGSQGYVNGLLSLKNTVASAGEDVGNAAIYATASQMSKISSILDSGVDFQPVIAPVVDLSHVYTGVNSIHSLMGQTYELANVNARMSAERDTSSLNDIASILNGLDFNSDNSDVVAAVSALSTDIMNLGVAIQGMRVQLGGKTVGVINSGLGQKQTMQNRGVSNG